MATNKPKAKSQPKKASKSVIPKSEQEQYASVRDMVLPQTDDEDEKKKPNKKP
jgi:hypothetical protein